MGHTSFRLPVCLALTLAASILSLSTSFATSNKITATVLCISALGDDPEAEIFACKEDTPDHGAKLLPLLNQELSVITSTGSTLENKVNSLSVLRKFRYTEIQDGVMSTLLSCFLKQKSVNTEHLHWARALALFFSKRMYLTHQRKIANLITNLEDEVIAKSRDDLAEAAILAQVINELRVLAPARNTANAKGGVSSERSEPLKLRVLVTPFPSVKSATAFELDEKGKPTPVHDVNEWISFITSDPDPQIFKAALIALSKVPLSPALTRQVITAMASRLTLLVRHIKDLNYHAEQEARPTYRDTPFKEMSKEEYVALVSAELNLAQILLENSALFVHPTQGISFTGVLDGLKEVSALWEKDKKHPISAIVSPLTPTPVTLMGLINRNILGVVP